MYLNPFKAKIAEGHATVGTFLSINSPATAEILSNVGFDWLIVDMEHGTIDLETASIMLSVMKGSHIIRVPSNDQTLIKRCLDSGPMGILVPMVNSKTDAENAVKFCKYPPQGVRGMGSSHASIYGLKMQEYISAANKEIMVIIQIEHKDAVEAIDDILSVPGIDVAFIGPMDLSTSMGFLGEPNHPQVSKAIEKVKASAKKNRVPLGIFSPTSDDVLRRLKEGFLFIGYGADSLFLTSQALKDMKIIREAL